MDIFIRQNPVIEPFIKKEPAKKNCWEILNCGREFEGAKVTELGICPAALPGENDGKNGGRFSGRFCWAVAGTFCNGKPRGTQALKLKNCILCDFLKQVSAEERQNFVL